MSAQATQWAWPIELDTGPKCVLVAIADLADGEGKCWPTIAKLVEITGAARSTVMSHLRALKAAGLVSVERRGPYPARIALRTSDARRAAP